MTQWTDGQIRANGIHLHYYRTGGDKPQIVLLHGVTDSGLCWTRIAKVLEADYDVIMLDARGHGLSDPPLNGFGPEILTEDAAQAIRELHLDHPYLLGHSMGAATAAQLAATYPDLPKAILLEDPPWHDFPPMPPTTEKDDKPNPWLTFLSSVKDQPPAERLANARKMEPNWDEEELGPWVESKVQFNTASLQSGFRLTPWREVVSKISCPLLLITGDPEKGAIVTAQDVADVQQQWQNGQSVHIAGAGHNIRRDRYDTYISTIQTFLKEHS